MKMEVYPKVFIAEKEQTVYVKTSQSGELFIKIQPMEIYGIKHTPKYRIDEETRYPFVPLKLERKGVYSIRFTFFGEQRYDVQIKSGGEVIYKTHLYSVHEDAAGLDVFKGDTHLHSCRSDGEGTPFEVGCAYRAAGYDFIAITDHHRFFPSIEGKEAFESLTNTFRVFRGEEVHNHDMGYFHIINFDGEFSVNDIVEEQEEYVEKEVENILSTTDFPAYVADKYDCAYRMFIAREIRRGGGVAIMAHPYWDCFGEYNMQEPNIRYLWEKGAFDALEVLAGCDWTDYGNNLQVALWTDLKSQGIKIPVVGASDAHSTVAADSLFNKQYSLVFAENSDGIKDAIKADRSVAVLAKKDWYFTFGAFRWAKYARFLLEEYFPSYVKLTKKHALALAQKDEKSITRTEKAILAYKKKFFVWCE